MQGAPPSTPRREFRNPLVRRLDHEQRQVIVTLRVDEPNDAQAAPLPLDQVSRNELLPCECDRPERLAVGGDERDAEQPVGASPGERHARVSGSRMPYWDGTSGRVAGATLERG